MQDSDFGESEAMPRRVAVFGTTGAGKATFGRRVATIFGANDDGRERL
jgi:ATP-dependent protease HslVU (ClpYQ) ATPase subunit